jgi:hypothetical protein
MRVSRSGLGIEVAAGGVVSDVENTTIPIKKMMRVKLMYPETSVTCGSTTLFDETATRSPVHIATDHDATTDRPMLVASVTSGRNTTLLTPEKP